MASFEYTESDSDSETVNPRRASKRRRNQEPVDHISVSQETVSDPDILSPPPVSVDLGDNRLRTGFASTREAVNAKAPSLHLPEASQCTQKYIEELERYRDRAKNKYQALQDIHLQRGLQNKETVKKLEEECDRPAKRVKEQAEKLKAKDEQHKQDLAIKDGQIAWAMSRKEDYLNHILNVLPPLVEAQKEREQKLKQLESVDARNEELVAEINQLKEEINQYKEDFKRLRDENKNLKILKVRLSKLSSFDGLH